MSSELKPHYDDVYTALHHIQVNLKAPKSQYNNFGKYAYRNCEDILEAVKKILPDGASLTLEDDIQLIGDRHYVCATATLFYKDRMVQASAYAREPLTKKGCDEAQITGASSSYARKYALNGLFLIDDSKDSDSKDNREATRPVNEKPMLLEQLKNVIDSKGITADTIAKWKEHFKIEHFNQLSDSQIKDLISKVKERT